MSTSLFGGSSGSGGLGNNTGGTFGAWSIPFNLDPTQQQFNNLVGGSTQQSQASSSPIDVTPPAFAALQSPLASTLLNYFGGGPVYSGVASSLSPLTPSYNPTIGSNPAAGTGTYATPLSPNEAALLSTIMGTGGSTNPVNTAAGNYINTVLNPNYPGSLATSPSTRAAISAATNPLVSAFQNVTMPNLAGQFVANGQVLNGPAQVGQNNPANGQGSSAFDKAAAIAGTGLQQSIASTAAPIAQQAMLAGTQQQTAAATQAPQLSSTEINNLVTTLQAEALPRLIQQYGMDQGLQQFNNNVNVMLQMLGIAATKAGPDIANQSQSESSGVGTKGIAGGFGEIGGGLGSMGGFGF